MLFPNLLPSTTVASSSPLRPQLHHSHIPSLLSPITVHALPSQGSRSSIGHPPPCSYASFLSHRSSSRAPWGARHLASSSSAPASKPRGLRWPQLLPCAPRSLPLSVLELASANHTVVHGARTGCSALGALPNLHHNADLSAPLLATTGAATTIVPLP
ncbi:hypothetical protein BS78_04G175300 [Paspalum vaginatum]|nr:hypothetical protein BS78_04G175300 [Paspalum vaginatum]